LATGTFAPGFRLSATDVVIVIVGGGAGVAGLQIDLWLAVAMWYVVAHFFLFCNVLRMNRSLEFLWAGLFVCLAVAVVRLELSSWPVMLGCFLSVTALFAAIEVRRPSYHGVGWRSLNPGLPEWWQANQAPRGRE